MNRFDLIHKIVYFDYNGETEQGYIKNFVTDDIVTVVSVIHGGFKDKELYTEMPINIDELFFNPIKNIYDRETERSN